MTQLSWRGTWNGRAPQGLAHSRARTIVRPTGGIFRGKFPSRKTGRMVHHEGLLELDAIYHFETSPFVESYTEQPATICYSDGADLRRYTPDFELRLTNGESVLVEIKPMRFAVESETHHKLLRVSEHFGRNGEHFTLLTDKELQVEPRLSNLRHIFHLAPRVRPTSIRGAIELQRLESLFPMRLGEATDLLSLVGLDPYSLLMMGLLRCDLNSSLDVNAILILNKENDCAWFRLSQRFNF